MATYWLLLVFIIHVICPKETSSNVLVKREHRRHDTADPRTGYRSGDHLIHSKHRTQRKPAQKPVADAAPQQYSYSARSNDDVDDYFSAMLDSDDDDDDDEEETEGLSPKSQLTAFGVSLMFGALGGGRWYVGEYLGATFKLLLFFFVCCTPCILLTCGGFGHLIAVKLGINSTSGGDDSAQSGDVVDGALTATQKFCAAIGGCLTSCSIPALIIWYIVDIILFAFNLIPDENGLPLNWKTTPYY